jgi:hypothetical protein
MRLYDDIVAAIALLEVASSREERENGYDTTVGDLLSAALMSARRARAETALRDQLETR